MRALRLAHLSAVRALFGWRRTYALTEGWREMRVHGAVVKDLCHLGHLFEPDIDPETGRLFPSDELIARAARRSMALALLARAEITHEELNLIRQGDTDDVETAFDDRRSL